MGMYVSELRSVPVGTFTYYAYLVDASGDGSHSKTIARALQELAVKSGTAALVVSGPRDLTYEVTRFLSLHASSNSVSLEHLFHEVSSLVISDARSGICPSADPQWTGWGGPLKTIVGTSEPSPSSWST